MIEVAIMIEGQNGLNWKRWKKMVHAVEELGFTGLFRSDHYTNARPPDKDSLELWVSLVWLASNTSRIEFGPLVTPVSFRHPTMTARMAAAVDDLASSRFHLGLGAGWQEREHKKFGWDLLSIPKRFQRFEEGIEVITRLLNSDEPVDYEGSYYHLREAILLPRPKRPGGPPIIIGGNGRKRTLPLVAQFADEWNSMFMTPSRLKESNGYLDNMLEKSGRKPQDLRRSMMTGCYFGRSDEEVKEIASRRDRTPEEIREIGAVIGTATEVVDHLGALAEAGIYRVMLQWLDLDDLDRLEAMAQSVLPQIKSER